MMKKNLCWLILLLITTCTSFAASNDETLQFTIDLIHVKNDRVNVELICPQMGDATVNFCLPKIVPGTYSIYDYGRFVQDFSAFDANGNSLSVSAKDENTWTISNADKLHRITYNVNDTYDAFDKDNPIFEPAGSNIEKDSNYVINTFAFVGYFEGKEQRPYKLTVLHPSNFYGGTAMINESTNATSDQFSEPNFREMADNPIMYCAPDTATVRVGNCSVLLAVYSPEGKVHARFLAGKMQTLLQAQGKYLGGTLPVNKYAFIIYLTDKAGISGENGALEHSYCSMYYMPELDDSAFAAIFPDYAAHEFFHILTPLTIHSDEIQYFDFGHPKMSEHLWLYEGTTEYHAHLVQEKYHLITRDEFLKRIGDKMTGAEFYFNDTLPFTEMSKGCVDQYKDQFSNVYLKGALIGMCIDIQLRSLSEGKYGLQNLIHDLGERYGKDHPFKDDELFDVIGSMTYPQITTFLKTYVAGSTPLPFEDIFKLVGVQYVKEKERQSFTLGRVNMNVKPPDMDHLFVSRTDQMNEFGKVMGYREGDEIISINGEKITSSNFIEWRQRWLSSVKEGDPFKVVVMRKNEDGKVKKVTLKTKVFKASLFDYNLLSFEDDATPEQIKIRDAWLNP